MKKNIFIPLLLISITLATFTFCTKESNPELRADAPTAAQTDDGSTQDRSDPEGCSSLCAIRINDASHTISVRDHFTVYKDFKPIWFYVSQSLNCGSSNLQIGQWYPITLLQNEQYVFTPEYWTQCNVPSNFCYPISIRVGSNIFNYNVNAWSQFAFTRQGCTIVPGWVE